MRWSLRRRRARRSATTAWACIGRVYRRRPGILEARPGPGARPDPKALSRVWKGSARTRHGLAGQNRETAHLPGEAQRQAPDDLAGAVEEVVAGHRSPAGDADERGPTGGERQGGGARQAARPAGAHD